MTRIVIVDDHDVVRAGLKGLLAPEPGFEVVAEASSGEEAVRLARSLEPDVMLMDVELPGWSGLEATERILKAQPGIGIVVLTAHARPPLPARLLEVGAGAFLSKACQADELFRAIRAVARGERYLAPEIAQQMALAAIAGTPNNPFEMLTPRELEIAMMLGQGMRAQDIGEVLKLSAKTIASHKYRMYDKLAIKSEVELLRLALRYGLISAETAAGEAGKNPPKSV
jgi:two-component system invasion response regulator UvrY